MRRLFRSFVIIQSFLAIDKLTVDLGVFPQEFVQETCVRFFELLIAHFLGNDVEMSISNMLRRPHQNTVTNKDMQVFKVDEIGLLPVKRFFRSSHENDLDMLAIVERKMDFVSVTSASGGVAYLMCRINFGSS